MVTSAPVEFYELKKYSASIRVGGNIKQQIFSEFIKKALKPIGGLSQSHEVENKRKPRDKLSSSKLRIEIEGVVIDVGVYAINSKVALDNNYIDGSELESWFYDDYEQIEENEIYRVDTFSSEDDSVFVTIFDNETNEKLDSFAIEAIESGDLE